MKALSLTQPWAQLVVEDLKRFETRSWRTYHRGRIAIHASKGFPRWAQRTLDEGQPIGDALNRPPEELARGAIIGLISIEECLGTGLMPRSPVFTIGPDETAYGDWALGRYAWALDAPFMFDEPIPCKGMLGLWTVPEDIRQHMRDAKGSWM